MTHTLTRVALLPVVALFLASCSASPAQPSPTSAAPSASTEVKPPLIPSWYEGEIVYFTVVNDNVVGVGNDVPAIPLYAFGNPGSQPQFDVLPAVPGDPGYNPWWKVIIVVVLDGRDVSTNPYTSAAELVAAEAAGDVQFIDTGFVFLCQVLPGRNR